MKLDRLAMDHPTPADCSAAAGGTWCPQVGIGGWPEGRRDRGTAKVGPESLTWYDCHPMDRLPRLAAPGCPDQLQPCLPAKLTAAPRAATLPAAIVPPAKREEEQARGRGRGISKRAPSGWRSRSPGASQPARTARGARCSSLAVHTTVTTPAQYPPSNLKVPWMPLP